MKVSLVVLIIAVALAPRARSEIRVEASAVFYSNLEASWELVVSESGDAKIRVWGKDTKKFQSFSVSPGDLTRLRESVSQMRFFELSQDSYGSAVIDGPQRSIRIADGKREKDVTIWWIDESDISSLAVPEEFERLAALWCVIRSIVPDAAALDYRVDDERALKAWRKRANKPVQSNSVDAPRQSRAVTAISRLPRSA